MLALQKYIITKTLIFYLFPHLESHQRSIILLSILLFLVSILLFSRISIKIKSQVSQKTVAITLPANGIVFAFLWASSPTATHCFLFLDFWLVVMHPSSNNCYKMIQKFFLITFKQLQTVLRNVYSILFLKNCSEM